jgi:hypothetical protein
MEQRRLSGEGGGHREQSGRSGRASSVEAKAAAAAEGRRGRGASGRVEARGAEGRGRGGARARASRRRRWNREGLQARMARTAEEAVWGRTPECGRLHYYLKE